MILTAAPQPRAPMVRPASHQRGPASLSTLAGLGLALGLLRQPKSGPAAPPQALVTALVEPAGQIPAPPATPAVHAHPATASET